MNNDIKHSLMNKLFITIILLFIVLTVCTKSCLKTDNPFYSPYTSSPTLQSKDNLSSSDLMGITEVS